MKKLINLLVLSFLLQIVIYAQPKYTEDYFTKTKKELESNPKIKEVYIHKEHHKNGNLKHHGIYITFKDDSVDRYFHVGRCYKFHENGKLAGFHQVDVNTLDDIDTSFYFKKNGKALGTDIYICLDTLDERLIDTSRTIKNPERIAKLYFGKNDNHYILNVYDTINGKRIFGKVSEHYYSVFYRKGVLKQRYNSAFNLFAEYYVPTGKMYDYNKEGKLKRVDDLDSIRENDPYYKNNILIYNYILKFEDISYKGNNTKEIQLSVNKKLEKIKKKRDYKIVRFTKGSYSVSGKTTECYIYYDEDTGGGLCEYFIAKTKEGFRVLTASEADEFVVGEETYISNEFNHGYLFERE